MSVYEVDLDGVLCTNTWGEYEKAIPLINNIIKVNSLHEAGNVINVNTGRGSTTGKDWYDLTRKQLREWGVEYTTLTVGEKPYYDFIIDDKAINSLEEDWGCLKESKNIGELKNGSK